ncbi:Ferrochelatase [Penicillium chermesinum]|nr:Ferrochelatase [Penicillium chermesinum]
MSFNPIASRRLWGNSTSVLRSASSSWRLNTPRSCGLATVVPPVTQDATGAKGPTAMVFMNMGGPSTTNEVHDFLSRLFSDGDLIPLGRLQSYMGPLIARRRTPKIQQQYSDIGGGSPIRKWSEYQCEEMCKILDQISPRDCAAQTLCCLSLCGPADRDHKAKTLMGEVDAAGAIKWSVIDRWPTHAGLVEAFAQNIEAQLKTYPEDKRDSVVLLFSAHSLPMSVVNRGDPYPAEVAATVHAVMKRLNFSNPYRLCWQSQVGPSAWLGAQTSDTVMNYVNRGHTDLVLVPIAFTSDHIETLYELDLEVMHEANSPGVKRAESLNGNPTFIRALADIAHEHLQEGESCSAQMTLRCQGCRSERCLEQKKFFAGERSHLVQ